MTTYLVFKGCTVNLNAIDACKSWVTPISGHFNNHVIKVIIVGGVLCAYMGRKVLIWGGL